SYALSWKPCQGDSLNLSNHRIRRWCCSLIPAKLDSLPHAHAQTTKTYFYQGRLLASFQDDAKYEHVCQDTRSQGGKDGQDQKDKDLKISDEMTKSEDNDKGSRSKNANHEGKSLQRRQRQ
nr:hypothetical protein [Tanacetum cinerariifolium]